MCIYQSLTWVVCKKTASYQKTIRKLEQTIGVIVSSFRAFPYGQIYYRELGKCTALFLARSGSNFGKKGYNSQQAANELKWGIRNIFDAFRTH